MYDLGTSVAKWIQTTPPLNAICSSDFGFLNMAGNPEKKQLLLNTLSLFSQTYI